MNYDELAVIAGLMNFLRQLQYVYIEKIPISKRWLDGGCGKMHLTDRNRGEGDGSSPEKLNWILFSLQTHFSIVNKKHKPSAPTNQTVSIYTTFVVIKYFVYSLADAIFLRQVFLSFSLFLEQATQHECPECDVFYTVVQHFHSAKIIISVYLPSSLCN